MYTNMQNIYNHIYIMICKYVDDDVDGDHDADDDDDDE